MSVQPPSHHFRAVKRFVAEYAELQDACARAFSRHDLNKANDCIDRMRALERTVQFVPEGGA